MCLDASELRMLQLGIGLLAAGRLCLWASPTLGAANCSLFVVGAGGALVGLIFWGLRRVGLSGATAALGALLAFAIPDVAGWAFQLQPDALAALWSVALGLALAACATGHENVRRALLPMWAHDTA